LNNNKAAADGRKSAIRQLLRTIEGRSANDNNTKNAVLY